jgi:hypothetical protein
MEGKRTPPRLNQRSSTNRDDGLETLRPSPGKITSVWRGIRVSLLPDKYCKIFPLCRNATEQEAVDTCRTARISEVVERVFSFPRHWFHILRNRQPSEDETRSTELKAHEPEKRLSSF